jgi:hypothetical protein
MSYRLVVGLPNSHRDPTPGTGVDVLRETLDEVLVIAMGLNDDGAQEALLVVGDDGVRLDKREIAERIFLERPRLQKLRLTKY